MNRSWIKPPVNDVKKERSTYKPGYWQKLNENLHHLFAKSNCWRGGEGEGVEQRAEITELLKDGLAQVIHSFQAISSVQRTTNLSALLEPKEMCALLELIFGKFHRNLLHFVVHERNLDSLNCWWPSSRVVWRNGLSWGGRWRVVGSFGASTTNRFLREIIKYQGSRSGGSDEVWSECWSFQTGVQHTFDGVPTLLRNADVISCYRFRIYFLHDTHVTCTRDIAQMVIIRMTTCVMLDCEVFLPVTAKE